MHGADFYGSCEPWRRTTSTTVSWNGHGHGLWTWTLSWSETETETSIYATFVREVCETLIDVPVWIVTWTVPSAFRQGLAHFCLEAIQSCSCQSLYESYRSVA